MPERTLIQTRDCATWHGYVRWLINRNFEPRPLREFQRAFEQALPIFIKGQDLDITLPEEPEGRRFVAECAMASAVVRLQGKPSKDLLDGVCDVLLMPVETRAGAISWLRFFCAMWEMRAHGEEGPLEVRAWDGDDGKFRMSFRSWIRVEVDENGDARGVPSRPSPWVTLGHDEGWDEEWWPYDPSA